MQAFEFTSPTYFSFGKGAENKVGELCCRFGASKVLIHYGGQSAEKSGLLDRVRASLTHVELPFVELGGVQPNPRVKLVRQGIELARREGVDFVLAVGGGSAMDSAKAIALGVPWEGDVWEIYRYRKPTTECLPIAVVPTLPATGSEASNSSVISNDDEQMKYGYNSDLIRPVFAAMNPELCFTLPKYQIACGIVDMLAHILERYLSNTPDVGLTDRLCEGAMKAIIEYAPRVMENPSDYDAMANIMWASTIAHNNVLGVGREQDWGSHAMEHELSALYDVAHGAGLAVVFPAFMLHTLAHAPERYAQLAHRVWNVETDFADLEETGRRGIMSFKTFFRSLGMPTNFEELGAKEEDIPYLVERVRLNNGKQLGYFMPLDREGIRAVFELCL